MTQEVHSDRSSNRVVEEVAEVQRWVGAGAGSAEFTLAEKHSNDKTTSAEARPASDPPQTSSLDMGGSHASVTRLLK